MNLSSIYILFEFVYPLQFVSADIHYVYMETNGTSLLYIKNRVTLTLLYIKITMLEGYCDLVSHYTMRLNNLSTIKLVSLIYT